MKKYIKTTSYQPESFIRLITDKLNEIRAERDLPPTKESVQIYTEPGRKGYFVHIPYEDYFSYHHYTVTIEKVMDKLNEFYYGNMDAIPLTDGFWFNLLLEDDINEIIDNAMFDSDFDTLELYKDEELFGVLYRDKSNGVDTFLVGPNKSEVRSMAKQIGEIMQTAETPEDVEFELDAIESKLPTKKMFITSDEETQFVITQEIDDVVFMWGDQGLIKVNIIDHYFDTF